MSIVTVDRCLSLFEQIKLIAVPKKIDPFVIELLED